MDVDKVVIQGRHCSVTDRFRSYVTEKLDRLDRFSSKIIRIEVLVSGEKNPRRSDRSERVEITVLSKGPAIRGEATADDRYAALDLALDRLLARLRKAADRRRIHHGSRTPRSVAQATAGGVEAAESLARIDAAIANSPRTNASRSSRRAKSGARTETRAQSGADSIRSADTAVAPDPNGALGETSTEVLGAAPGSESEHPGGFVGSEPQVGEVAGIEVVGDGPLVVREKVHDAASMTLDQALYEMELVGHDFYLFVDADHELPSVVYRRKGYDYGVIRLQSSPVQLHET